MLAFCMVLSAFPPFIFYCMLQLLRVGGGLYNSWHRLVHYSSSQPCRMQNCQSSRISNILGGVVALCELSSVQMFGSSNLLLQTCDCKDPYTIPPKPKSPYLQPCIGLTGWAWQEGQESRLFVFVYPFSLCYFLTSFIKIEFGKQCKQVSIDFGWWGLCPWNALGVTSCTSHIFPVLESTGAQLFGRSRRSWFMRGFCASSEIEDESLWMFGYKSIRQYMHCMYARSYFLRTCDNVYR